MAQSAGIDRDSNLNSDLQAIAAEESGEIFPPREDFLDQQRESMLKNPARADPMTPDV